MASSSSLSSAFLKVNRCEPEFVTPSKPTPKELKLLSDIDDQEGLRFQIPTIFFYKNNNNNNPSVKSGQNPIRVIREALGKALVYYYPLAGRLREGSNRKLMVDCTGEGVLFVAAKADIEFERLGDAIRPPCPFLDEFLYNVPGSDGILGCPLLLIQVTELKCGGFVLAVRFNHTMTDGFGLVQFLNTVAEMARGINTPSIFPVWQREILNARNPPRITCTHQEYQQMPPNSKSSNNKTMVMDPNDVVQRSFFFSPNQIRNMRRQLPKHLQNCSRFELITACMWKCRTIALELDIEEAVRISCLTNIRGNKNIKDLSLPSGYYGNAFAYPAEVSNARVLRESSLGFAVELVKKAKAQMSEDYIKSVASLMVIRGRPLYTVSGNYIVSDTTKAGAGQVDFGWGFPVFAGPAMALSLISFHVLYEERGVKGVVVPICLPTEVAMERFEQELKKITDHGHEEMPYRVKHEDPEFIVPAGPTPHELKPLSDIDDQEGLRFHVPFIFFYKSNPSVERNEDPIGVIKEALGRALVYYYPFAGRLKEGFNRKLVVDCTGEGVLFIAASANIRFEQLGSGIWSPFTYLDEFLCNVPGLDGVLGCPLLLVQVTRLLCGGFILAIRLNHAISDAFGLVQLLKTVAEMARGAKIPSFPPVWQRELFNARTPPRITCSHHEFQVREYQKSPSNGSNLTNNDILIQRSFFFGPKEMKAIRKHLPPNFPKHCSQFVLLTACLWKCRTSALKIDPEEEVLMCSVVNARGKNLSSALSLPLGYYGNAVVYPAAVTKAEDLSRNSLEYAVELVKKAIAEANEEYFRSVVDFLATKGRPMFTTVGNFIISDNRHVGYEEVDFKWGSPIYAGIATSFPVISFYMQCKRGGEEGIVVPISLPVLAMERFQQELKKMIST